MDDTDALVTRLKARDSKLALAALDEITRLRAELREARHERDGETRRADVAQEELARVRKLGEGLADVLGEICSPIAAMQQRAKDVGAKLDGAVALQLANDVGYLQGLARAALAAWEGRE